MTRVPDEGGELARLYRQRFQGLTEYRMAVWRILVDRVFTRWIHPQASILELGAGRGEFINQVRGDARYAMDLNPETRELLDPAVRFLEQDCSAPWAVAECSLDVVFTSNFFEHLPDKAALRRTLEEAHRAIRPGGCLIAMGPNIRLVPGGYWDFWDHYLPLTERSLAEVGKLCGFTVERAWPATMPYSMSLGFLPPLWCVALYCRLPFLWRLFGKQFILVLRKPP